MHSPVNAEELVRLIYEYGNIPSREFYLNHPDFVESRRKRQDKGDSKIEATLAEIVKLAEQITEGASQ